MLSSIIVMICNFLALGCHKCHSLCSGLLDSTIKMTEANRLDKLINKTSFGSGSGVENGVQIDNYYR